MKFSEMNRKQRHLGKSKTKLNEFKIKQKKKIKTTKKTKSSGKTVSSKKEIKQ